MAILKNELIEQIDNSVRQHFAGVEGVPEEDDVREMYESLYDAFSMISIYKEMAGNRDDVIESLVHQYCSELYVTKKFGFAFKDEEVKPWLNEAEEVIEGQNGWFYWMRYKKYLMYTKRWARKHCPHYRARHMECSRSDG